GEDFTVFNGPDEQFIAGRAIGADGGIGGTYAVMPELFLAADEAFKKGDMERAKGIQWDIDAIIYKLCEAKGNLYATMKEVIKRRTGIDLGSVRAPLAPLAESDEPVVQESVRLIDEAIRRWA
ncbi:MAG: dihydrodipicolinate synthase family protein, partial [Bullifex sp.]|nr:dihydrodipicolinate synthase family protein [Bullifex sp.]